MNTKEKQRLIKIGPFIPENSDGCTVLSWPYNKLTGRQLPFRHCCVVHDEAYWYGGTKKQRKDADLLLMNCVAKHGRSKFGDVAYWILSRVMYVAVRIGGSPKIGVPWRWEFGTRYTVSKMFGGYLKD